ncbi:Toxin-antitoxin biofilm protein TabA [Anaerohalosphaera lusitana]|uniref:Toxin-antitoxin biofilm protein TabA n=1 Tax=Anaerohalosphaera lusitana TaxID=1936003 RepID=A0A1U9NQ92_9BACT|nr:YhcH/YjgK/YiaL family protein [Anaerohalosphaera lusitana]AQT69888.1 Toxin-antitoxin biofilm protein TabA [Anaerohalosphaera lusitana]
MVFDRIENAGRYAALGGGNLGRAFEVLQRQPFTQLPDGRYEVDGERLFFNVDSYQTQDWELGRFEAHRRYLDIQLITAGAEVIGHAHVGDLAEIEAYDGERDVAFYEPSIDTGTINMQPGMFAMFYPHDAHMPGRTLDEAANVRKVVIKVRLD